MHATRSPELLRIPEAAERLNVSRASVYRWIDEGRLPAVQLGGRGAPLRVPAAELERWIYSMSTSGGGSFVGSEPTESAMGRGSFVDVPADERRETSEGVRQLSSPAHAGER